MQEKLKNIILVSSCVSEASRVAKVLASEFGFVYARVNSPLALNSRYAVSVCAEVVDHSELSKFGCIIHLEEFRDMHPSLIAEKVFTIASDHFIEGAYSNARKCA